jgi:HSP20 family protein
MRLQLHADTERFEHFSQKMGFMMVELQRRSYHPFSDRRGWKPALNVYENADAFVVCADLAGMTADQIDVRTEGNFLVIRGDRAMPTCEACVGPASVHLMEVDSGPFFRKVEIPGNVDTGRISAGYKDGFLWVILPKRSS